RMLMKEALRVAEGGYRSLSSGDRKLGLKVLEIYKEFKNSWIEVYEKLSKANIGSEADDAKELLALGRLAASGFFMARLSIEKSL
ncbi:hypothetical protein KEJ36_01400, partial [Candidatus Bathyarchaeota archaeon]|nr:hypothetical protein [Candidatus Bathyarchaeota archaeon]